MIEELKRKKLLGSLGGRMPAQEDAAYDSSDLSLQADEVLNDEEPMDISAVDAPADPTPEQSIRPSTRMPQPAGYAYADVLTGAAPALLGLLTGNARRANMGFKQGDDYLKGLHKTDEAANAKLIKTRGDLGEPVYMRSRDAVGMEAYQPTKDAKKAGGTGARKLFESVADPTKTMWAGFNEKGEPVNPYSQTTMTPDKWQPAEKVVFKKQLDKYGNEIEIPTTGRAGLPIGAPTKTKEGEGETVQVGDKEVLMPSEKVKQARSLMEKHLPVMNNYQQAITEIAVGKAQIADKNSAPQVQKLAIGKIMKAVESKMTEGDRAEYKNEYSALLSIKQKIDMLKTNEIPEPLRKAFVKASSDILNGIQFSADKYNAGVDRAFSGNNKAYSKYIRSFMSGASSKVPYTKSEKQQNFDRLDEKSEQPGMLNDKAIENRKKILEQALKNK